MNTRVEILKALVELSRPMAEVRRELSQFKWDSEELVRLPAANVVRVLERFAAGALTAEEVADWADTLEGRDDVACEARVRDALAELANPAINGALTTPSARELVARLRTP